MSDDTRQAAAPRPLRLGLIVNPLAGIGGSVALKGSDGAAIVAQARSRGAELRAHARTVRALRVIAAQQGRFTLHTCAGAMGADAAAEAGLVAASLHADPGAQPCADHTIAAARAMAALPVDLLLFAGGDGTARDVCAAIGTRVPALGIPAGVKMHSGVFAVSPEAAGEIVRELLAGTLTAVDEAEVRDLDEDAFRAGRVVARHYGELLVPRESRYVQHVKQGAPPDADNVAADIAADIVEAMEPGCLYLLGPGSTTYAIKQALGIEGTLLGVDAVRDRACVARDATERQLLDLLATHAGPARIVVTAIGGQGHVFGRGNQQLGARVIRAVGVENIVVVAARAKIRALEGRPLLVDTNDAELDRQLHRHLRVVTGYRESVLYPAG